MRGDWNVSIRRACRVFLVDTSTYHYKSRRPGQAALEQRIKEICQTRIRYGYRRVHVLLRREWKALPKDLPPKSTAHDYLGYGTGTARWSASTMRSTSRRANRPDVKPVRRWPLSTRKPRRVLKKGALARSSGYDAGKKVKGRKRHILVDTLGLLLNVVVHPADVQDRDGALLLLRRARRRSRSSSASLLMVAMPGRRWRSSLPNRSVEAGDRQAMRRSWLRGLGQRAGSSKGPSPGSVAIAAWLATSSVTLDRRRLRPPRHDPNHAAAACCKRLVMNPNFPDGL